MVGSIFRKLGLSKRDDSSSDSDEEVHNQFTAPSDSPPPSSDTVFPGRAESVFSRASRSSITEGSKSTRRTKYTSGTGDTSNSLRSEGPSKQQRLALVDLESGTQPSEPVVVPHTLEDVIFHLRTLVSKMQVLDQQSDGDNAPRISATLSKLVSDYTKIFNTAQIDSARIPDELLSTMLRIVLGFTDVYLAAPVHTASRMHLLRALYHFALSLDLMGTDGDGNSYANASTMMDGGSVTVPQPKVFAIGSGKRPVPNEAALMTVLDNLVSRSTPIVEQEGAYVAPVLRGLSPRFSVATLCLGIPDMQREHTESIIALKSQLKQLHVYGRRDCIVTAAGTVQSSSIKVPYRVPTDPSSPPMSISVASTGANYVSGTLGGFLYPHASKSKAVDRHVYALTCGHVCLRPNEGENASKFDVDSFRPEIAYPSPVLRKLFKKALAHQSSRFGPDSPQYNAFKEAMDKVDQQPSTVLGDVVWGERTVVGGRMSDIAVIKCNPGIECNNWLGNDIDLSQYDPSLIMNQLRVKCLVGKSRGLQVFKYGSTSKYTTGVISTLRIAYWANGALQTSEFAIRSGDSTSFANAGDSGAWILSSNPEGLGVAGMLHSFDGEYKEFGLYMPMSSILDRLEAVTETSWGVLGVPSELDEIDEDAELCG